MRRWRVSQSCLYENSSIEIFDEKNASFDVPVFDYKYILYLDLNEYQNWISELIIYMMLLSVKNDIIFFEASLIIFF